MGAPKQAHTWARDELDWYVEPGRVTEQLLTVERFVGDVWDPCCGAGNIVSALLAGGYQAGGSDVVRRIDDRSLCCGTQDFLQSSAPTYDNVVMNPPFFRAKGAEAFIRQALALTAGKVCAFVSMKFIAGAGRAAGLFAEHPPVRIWIIPPRPSCPPGTFLQNGGKAEGGTDDWCWLVWDNAAPAGTTQLGWLRGGIA